MEHDHEFGKSRKSGTHLLCIHFYLSAAVSVGVSISNHNCMSRYQSFLIENDEGDARARNPSH